GSSGPPHGPRRRDRQRRPGRRRGQDRRDGSRRHPRLALAQRTRHDARRHAEGTGLSIGAEGPPPREHPRRSDIGLCLAGGSPAREVTRMGNESHDFLPELSDQGGPQPGPSWVNPRWPLTGIDAESDLTQALDPTTMKIAVKAAAEKAGKPTDPRAIEEAAADSIRAM